MPTIYQAAGEKYASIPTGYYECRCTFGVKQKSRMEEIDRYLRER